MLSDSHGRGSQPRNTMNPVTRHAAATARSSRLRWPTVSQRCSKPSCACIGPGASVSLIVSMDGMLLVPFPACGSAVKNAAPIHRASHTARLHAPATPASAAATGLSRGSLCGNRTSAATAYSSAAPG
jgi:hypothetical protein